MTYPSLANTSFNLLCQWIKLKMLGTNSMEGKRVSYPLSIKLEVQRTKQKHIPKQYEELSPLS